MRWWAWLIVLVGCGDNVRLSIDGGTSVPDVALRDVIADGSRDASDSELDGPLDASPAPVTVTTYSAGVQGPLAFVAAQDGANSWHTLHSTDGVYTFDAPSGRYGIAYVCGTSAAGSLVFDYATRDAYSARIERCGTAAVSTGTLATGITGLPPGSAAQVSAANLSDWGDLTVPTVTLAPLRAGNTDVVVSYWPDSYQIGRVGVLRGVVIAAGTTTSIAVNAIADTVAVTWFSVSVSGKQLDESLAVEAELITAMGTSARITPQPLPPPPGADGRYYGLPTSALEPGDMHVIRARAFNLNKSREIDQYVHVPVAVTVSLPPLFVAGVSVAALSPYVRLRAQFVPFATEHVYQLDARQVQSGKRIAGTWTSGWIAGASALTWDQPDFSGLEDWHVEWALGSGQTTSWSVAAIRDSNLALGDPAWDGVTVARSASYGSVTP